MISFDEAFAIVKAAARPLGTERVALEEAAGRVLGTPVVSRIDGPRSDVSTMDGYAVREADLGPPPCRLRVIGASFPGAPYEGPVKAGTCVRIFTGAALPSGSDRVVIQEVVDRQDDEAVIAGPPSPSLYIRKKASDFAAGDVLVAAGRRLDARALVAAGAADVGEVEVYLQPRVAIVATGDELRKPGATGVAEAIPDSITLGLEALAKQCGAVVVDRQILPDDLAATMPAVAKCLRLTDVLIVTGGASVGERDYAKRMFEDLEILFAKVAIKPGKPVWLGRASGRLAIGLPGNPTSALVTARLLLKPLLAGLGGLEPDAALRWRRAPLAVAMEAGSDREIFWRAKDEDGKVVLIPDQDSGAQRTLAEADLLVRQAAGSPALAAGDEVEIVDF
ncbi:MAG TPA: molybdopterin molybdotransferase MoeA [Allosphingosinicella sp.]